MIGNYLRECKIGEYFEAYIKDFPITVHIAYQIFLKSDFDWLQATASQSEAILENFCYKQEH